MFTKCSTVFLMPIVMLDSFRIRSLRYRNAMELQKEYSKLFSFLFLICLASSVFHFPSSTLFLSKSVLECASLFALRSKMFVGRISLDYDKWTNAVFCAERANLLFCFSRFEIDFITLPASISTTWYGCSRSLSVSNSVATILTE